MPACTSTAGAPGMAALDRPPARSSTALRSALKSSSEGGGGGAAASPLPLTSSGSGAGGMMASKTAEMPSAAPCSVSGVGTIPDARSAFMSFSAPMLCRSCSALGGCGGGLNGGMGGCGGS